MEDFATFEIAKKLKEKGYPQVKQNTLAMYDEDGKWYSMTEPIDTAYSFEFEDFDDRDCVCPTISQVLKWLREEKKIHITVLVITDCSNDADNNTCEDWCFWSFSVINLNDGSTLYGDFEKIDCIEYQSYEEAALAGIEYVLDNLI